MLRVGVKFHDLALIDEREIDGHMAKNEVDLLWRELARGDVQDFVLCGFCSFRPYFATKFASLIRKFGSKFAALKFEAFCALKFVAEFKFAPPFFCRC